MRTSQTLYVLKPNHPDPVYLTRPDQSPSPPLSPLSPLKPPSYPSVPFSLPQSPPDLLSPP